jgi:hypothetical protein
LLPTNPHPPVTNRRIAAMYHGHPILQYYKKKSQELREFRSG